MPANRITSNSPWHVVLLLDDSQSMEGTPIAFLNNAVREMIEEMILLSGGKKAYFRITIVSFGSHANLVSEAVAETDIDIEEVTSLEGSSGVTNAAAALGLASDVLERNPGTQDFFEPFVFFFSDGVPFDGSTQEKSCAAALEASDRLKNLSLPSGRPHLIAIGVGDRVDDSFMSEVASIGTEGRRLYRKLDGPKDAMEFFPEIGTVAASQVADMGKSGAELVEDAIMDL